MGFADLHIHSTFSYDGTATIPAILKYVSERTPLGVIAITDHDTMDGIPQALDLAPAYGIEVIPGMEINSADGHVLGLFLQRPVPAGLSLEQTVLRVAGQGGLCVAPHPEARGTNSLSIPTIAKALRNPQVAQALVGMEAFNGGLVYTRSNVGLSDTAKLLGLACIGNSDAHLLEMIGHGSTAFEGSTASDLHAALWKKQTEMRQDIGLTGLAVLGHYLPRYFLRKLGWVIWNEKPQAPLRYIRFDRQQQLMAEHLRAGS